MKLEQFKKMDKQKKIIIGSIAGILLIIGSIVLYRTYALYEEEKTFDTLKGQIPDFGYDIKMLSVVVDGEKSKTIPSRGLYKTQIECSNGTRGEWDYNAWNLTFENVSENARCNITFTSNLSEEEYNKYIETGKALRRNTYRGKDITSYHNDGSLYEMISSGRFDDIYVGDYIMANDIKWLVADIDNYLFKGAQQLQQHHLTMIPAQYLTTSVMNESSSSDGGYYNSKMKQETLPNVLSTYVEPAFGSHILTYNTVLTNSVNVTVPSNAGGGWLGSSDAYAWYDSQIDLMSEVNVSGVAVVSSSIFDIGIDDNQYSIFMLKPELKNSDGTSRFMYWLKGVGEKGSFTAVGTGGNVSGGGQISTRWADASLGVRPRFLIG